MGAQLISGMQSESLLVAASSMKANYTLKIQENFRSNKYSH